MLFTVCGPVTHLGVAFVWAVGVVLLVWFERPLPPQKG